MSSPSPHLDSFVFCLRERMDPENPDNKSDNRHTDSKYVKVPKSETADLRDEIIRHLRTTDGNMKVGEFVDLVDKYYNIFLQRQGKLKRGAIKTGSKMAGVDPSTKKGRKWWVDGCGGDEDSPFIESYGPVFTPSGAYHEYFEDLQMCLIKECPKAFQAKKKKKKRSQKKKKDKSEKKKPSKKKKKPSKKKPTRKKKKQSHKKKK